MTKLRWEDPPRESDAALYDAAKDSALRFLGQRDAELPDVASRLAIKDRLLRISEDVEWVEKWLGDIQPEHAAIAANLRTALSRMHTESEALRRRLVQLPKNDRIVF